MSVVTVAGIVEARDLGVVCPHEHIFIDLSCYLEAPADPDERELAAHPLTIELLGTVRHRPELVHANYRLDERDVAIAEVEHFKRLGGGTIVDVTPVGIGRTPRALAAVAANTGVHVVMGSGFYIHPSHPPHVAALSTEDLAALIVGDLLDGVDGTGIRAGIIGELGVSPAIHPDEVKVLRAGARAQLETGAPITIHAVGGDRLALQALDILERSGVSDFQHTVISHQDARLDLDYHLAVLDRGAMVEFDLFGHTYSDVAFGGYWMPSDGERVEMLRTLVDRSYTSQLLLSQDVCLKMLLKTYGGNGYAYLSEWIESRLADVGISSADIKLMRVSNPARVLDVF
jgi:phosphotriesterase-related protein